MAKYVDGFVLSVPKKNTEKYKKMAKEAADVWMRFGALDYKECMVDDEKPDKVVFTFKRMAKTKKNEVTWFSFIVFKDRKHRDNVNKKVMAYFEKKYGKDAMHDMPFDMKRFAYAGFEAKVEG